MVLGYDEETPKDTNYHEFVTKLTSGLCNETFQGVSLMFYGSFVRGDYVPGRSDIDAILVFPDDVLIDKEKLSRASKILASAEKGNNIPFQVTIADISTMRDGRFNPYNPNFKPYFEEEGRVVVGPDYRAEFRYEIDAHSDQSSIRFNLRKSRQGLLFVEYAERRSYVRFLEGFKKSLDASSRASKQILSIIDGEVRRNRFSALEELSKEFPDLNLETLKRMKDLYQHIEKLHKLYRNKEEVLEMWEQAVTFFESLIKSYMTKYPNTKISS